MLQMPPIQRRDIDRLKGTRAIRIERAAPTPAIDKNHPEAINAEDRRLTVDRRQRDIPVANDRRRKGRRFARKQINPKIRALLDNSESQPATTQGRFVDESV